jgi:hypothetical protein
MEYFRRAPIPGIDDAPLEQLGAPVGREGRERREGQDGKELEGQDA